jgi:hypothetical protein
MRLIGLVVTLSLMLAPLPALAQQAEKVARLGFLGLFTPELAARTVAAVRDGLGSWAGAKARTSTSCSDTHPGTAIGLDRSQWS